MYPLIGYLKKLTVLPDIKNIRLYKKTKWSVKSFVTWKIVSTTLIIHALTIIHNAFLQIILSLFGKYEY